MLTLMLLRHAKAEPGSARSPDKDRPLAERGLIDATRMGEWIAREKLIPDRVICSTARRTRETWTNIAPALGKGLICDFDVAIYEASVARLLTVVRRAPSTAKRLMLIGHNPGFEMLTTDLMRDAETGAAARLAEKYPTSGLAVLDLPIDKWTDTTPRTARLTRFTAPRYWG